LDHPFLAAARVTATSTCATRNQPLGTSGGRAAGTHVTSPGWGL